MSEPASLWQRARRLADRQPPVVRVLVERVLAMNPIEQAIVIASYTFTALFPLLIVYSGLAPGSDSRDFAGKVIERFDLSGAAARSVRDAFTSDTGGGVTVFSFLLVLVFALSFCRAMQRMYERAWQLEPRGFRDTKWALLWLAVVAGYVTVRPPIEEALSGIADALGSIALGVTLWLLTPYLLVGRRISWRRLVPTALLTSLAMTLLSVASVLWVPRSVESSADEFGVIGVAFALLGWLFAAGCGLTFTAAAGAVIGERLGDRRDRGPKAAEG